MMKTTSKIRSEYMHCHKVRSDISLIESFSSEEDINQTTETKGKCTDYYSFSDLSESIEDDGIPILDLLLSYSAIDEEVIFQNNGYQKIEKICNTLQGQLFKAIKIYTNSGKTDYVTIKKTEKGLFQQQIAIQNDFNFYVSENIIKESLILKYLTIDNQPIGSYIVKYIDFFESDTDYYLVMEYVDSPMNLKQFIAVCHEYIKNDQLSIKEYNKILKYLLWQLFVTVQWLHLKMHCCHLDLCTENIMLTDIHFVKTKHGISIDPDFSIKLCDFGVSEVFNPTNCKTNINYFLCEKHGLSLENEAYFAPNVFNGDIFDARCADNWSLGMILFECITGRHLYGAMDINTDSIQSGYWSLHNKKLKKYLKIHCLLRYFNVNAFDLVNRLLDIDEYQRLKGMDILRHKWFTMYYKKYNGQILKKFIHSNKTDVNKYTHFPFYH